MKPNWKDAPEWANWLAMDDDGEWWWFELEPHIKNGRWWAALSGKDERCALNNNAKWKDSLEKRPENP